MRRCFQCGALTDVAALTRVGDGEFCATCFRELLATGAQASAGASGKAATRVDAGSPPATGAHAEASAAARGAPRAGREPGAPRATPLAPERAKCLVCDCDLTGVPAVVFLGGEICGPCSAEMAAELDAAHAGPSTEPSLDAAHADRARGGALGSGDDADSMTDAPSAPEGAASLPFTPGASSVSCAGCDRPMPGPGSYRVLRGKPYCAACVPFFSRLPPSAYEAPAEASGMASSDMASSDMASSDMASSVPAPGSAAPSAPASSSPLARPGQCDCCRRALDAGSAQREGFALCSACLTSDAELALSVARARHRRALARLRSKLEGSA